MHVITKTESQDFQLPHLQRVTSGFLSVKPACLEERSCGWLSYSASLSPFLTSSVVSDHGCHPRDLVPSALANSTVFTSSYHHLSSVQLKLILQILCLPVLETSAKSRVFRVQIVIKQNKRTQNPCSSSLAADYLKVIALFLQLLRNRHRGETTRH